ncbi:hypothetical protein [Polaromonas sp. CF318]|uniref:hypothetical protein n=1 Tax=Polaromonas sp. CF318 TaxID=1144318 RepID=UPI0012FB6F03|nr:hypothetical protein [Polaromonas sp. CF318]
MVSFTKSDLALLKETILELIQEAKAQEQQAAVKAENSPLSDDETKQLLKALLQSYRVRQNFSVGDIVQWKPGLKNRRFPAEVTPAIVVEVFNVPVTNPITDHGSPYFQEVLDMKIGVVTDTGNMNTYVVDSARFVTHN